MDITFLRIVSTLVSLATFLGILGWVYLGRNKHAFDAAAHLPFEQD
ncbi:MAG: cbb3-type cytochrome oxidase subunit 3 [Rhodoferax sp.]|nr:cbb3-type cytochrome oxidase subunit 3 [Rhodoferax sp.]